MTDYLITHGWAAAPRRPINHAWPFSRISSWFPNPLKLERYNSMCDRRARRNSGTRSKGSRIWVPSGAFLYGPFSPYLCGQKASRGHCSIWTSVPPVSSRPKHMEGLFQSIAIYTSPSNQDDSFPPESPLHMSKNPHLCGFPLGALVQFYSPVVHIELFIIL